MAARKAFTLLEVLLALGFTALAIVLMGMAIKVNADVVNKSSAQVLEAQMARELLQAIAYDLRQAAPYQPPAGSSSSTSGGSASTSGGSASTSGGSASSSGSSSSGAMSSSSSSSSSSGSASSSSGTSSTTPVCGGIFGDSQGIRVETSRRPRLTRALLAASQDGSQPASLLGDLRVVSYTIGQPNGVSAGAPVSSGENSNGGLYRADMEREQFYAAVQQGQAGSADTAEKLGDPNVGEVVELKFSYFDGSTENDEWDSIQQGKLPCAVRVTISVRPAVPGSSSTSIFGSLGSSGDKERPVKRYDMLVDIPNASVPADAFQSLAQADPVPRSRGARSSAGTAAKSSGAGTGSSSSSQ